jgi:hypothetical protein
MRRAPDPDLAAAFRRCNKAFGWTAEVMQSQGERLKIYVNTDSFYKIGKTYRPGQEAFYRYVKIYQHYIRYKPRKSPHSKHNTNENEPSNALDNLISVYEGQDVLSAFSEQLRKVHSKNELYRFLKPFRRSRPNIRRLDAALRNIDQDIRTRIFELSCELHDELWCAGERDADILPVFLGRMDAFPFCDPPNYRRIIDKIEVAVRDADPARVQALEPLCMSAMMREMPGPFVNHITLLLENKNWQESDNRARELYYGSVEAMIDNVSRHVRERSVHLQCHDVGTILALSEGALLSVDEKIDFSRQMRRSLEEISVGRNLIDRFQDRMLLAAVVS